MQDQYRQAEDKYFRLRGQFDTGRLSQDEFDAALRELMIQDSQGRYWMLGADSGKWYYYDGAKWILGDPYPGAAPRPNAPISAVPRAAPSAPAQPRVRPASSLPPAPPPSAGRGFPVAAFLVGLAIVLLALGAFLLFMYRDRLFGAPPAAITPIIPPTITRAPSPTAVAVLPTPIAPTDVPATAIPTAVPTEVATPVPTNPPPTTAAPTAPPAVTVIVITAVPPTSALPTLLPTITNAPTPTAVTPTVAAPTAPPPTNTPTVICPSGVCVTSIVVDSAPRRNQPVTFTATFVNSTDETRYYSFVILVFDPNKEGPNKGFGESPPLDIAVPRGTLQFSVSYVVVTGPGGCIPLYASAAARNSPFEKPVFPNVSGDPATANFDVCP